VIGFVVARERCIEDYLLPRIDGGFERQSSSGLNMIPEPIGSNLSKMITFLCLCTLMLGNSQCPCAI